VHRLPLSLLAAVALVLAFSASAGANDATLRTTVNIWSKKIGADASSVSLAAQRHHPRRMTSSANRFHREAVHARAAIAAQRPSTAKGRRARELALKAFADYARAGSKWAASGRARLAHRQASSISLARAGARYARAGNTLLVSAGKLLR
jgi:hypothetical protein